MESESALGFVCDSSQAAEYVEKRLPHVLVNHPAFDSDLPKAFLDSFRQIDREYLNIAREEVMLT